MLPICSLICLAQAAVAYSMSSGCRNCILFTVTHPSAWHIVSGQDTAVRGRRKWGHLKEDPGTQNRKILFKVTHGSSWMADPEITTFPSFPIEASVPIHADHDLGNDLSPSMFTTACLKVKPDPVLKGTMLLDCLSPSLLSLTHTESKTESKLCSETRSG